MSEALRRPARIMMNITQHTLDTPYPVGPVHCYSAELAGELVLFDTGPPTEQAREYLQREFDLSRLRHVIVTHCHIDHYGLSAWLEAETDAQIWLPYRDGLKIRHHRDRLSQMGRLMGEYGFDRSYRDSFRGAMEDESVFPRFPERFKVVEEGLPLELGIEVIPCPGHSQGDLVFASEEWAVTGDVMLRGIFQSPLLDVDLETGLRFRNYPAYCATLNRLAGLRGKRILPGHRYSIESIDQNLLFYLDKLLERAERLKPFVGEANIARIIDHLFGATLTQPFHVYLKASEIIFILDFLADQKRLYAVLTEIGLKEPLVERIAAVAA
jgi:hydroxyacylglutathione hydrolase